MSVKTVRGALVAALLLVCVVMPANASAALSHNRLEAGIVREMNKVRAGHQLRKLRSNSGFAHAADVHSLTMLRSNVLSHGAFTQRVRRYVRARVIGENLAWMGGGCHAPTIVQMWLNSPTHRAVMLSRSFRRVGVGQRSSTSGCFITADFGSAR